MDVDVCIYAYIHVRTERERERERAHEGGPHQQHLDPRKLLALPTGPQPVHVATLRTSHGHTRDRVESRGPDRANSDQAWVSFDDVALYPCVSTSYRRTNIVDGVILL